MMVWFGVQEALASASGGPGFDMRRFISFFILITFAYSFVNFYNTAIPGIGTSLKGFIDGGTTNLVQIIGQDSYNTMTREIDAAAQNMGSSMPSILLSPYKSFVFFMVQMALCVASLLISAIVAYGVVASTIIGLLGPIFIPFLVFEKLDWLFWGWLKAYLGFSFYKVIAAATLNILSHLLTQYFVGLGQNLGDPQMMIAAFPFSDHLGGYNRVPPHQNPRHGTRAIQWRYWWTRWRLWRGNHGDSRRDVITLVETRNEVSGERRKDGRRDESHPGNYPCGRTLS